MAEQWSRQYRGTSPDRLFAACLKAVTQLNWKIQHTDAATRTLSCAANGKKIRIGGGQDMSVAVESAAHEDSEVTLGWGYQVARVFDHGEKSEISDLFFVTLDDVLGKTPEPITPAPLPIADSRVCPHCKGAMRPVVDVCPHCGATLKPWTLHAGAWWMKSDSGEWQWRDEVARTWRWYKDGMPSSPETTVRTPNLAIDPAVVSPPDAPRLEPATVSPEAGLADSLTAQLERLAELHERGALNDDQFEAAKNRLLGL